MSAPGLAAGEVVTYGPRRGRVLRAVREGDPDVLVKDLAVAGAREWWPAAEVRRTAAPTLTTGRPAPGPFACQCPSCFVEVFHLTWPAAKVRPTQGRESR